MKSGSKFAYQSVRIDSKERIDHKETIGVDSRLRDRITSSVERNKRKIKEENLRLTDLGLLCFLRDII